LFVIDMSLKFNASQCTLVNLCRVFSARIFQYAKYDRMGLRAHSLTPGCCIISFSEAVGFGKI
jgi:hypothetical protein